MCMNLIQNMCGVTGNINKEVNYVLDEWRIALEGKRLKISISKTVYIENNFKERYQEVDDT